MTISRLTARIGMLVVAVSMGYGADVQKSSVPGKSEPQHALYYLAFVSRAGDATHSPHAFVMWGIKGIKGIAQDTWIAFDSFGQYAAGQDAGALMGTIIAGHVPGVLMPDNYRESTVTHQITVPVSEEIFFKTHGIIDGWAKSWQVFSAAL